MAPTSNHGKICYLQIPAADVAASARFYSEIFGWKLRSHDDGATAFDDSTGQVSGMLVAGRSPWSGEPGLLVDIMVDDAEKTVAAIVAHGARSCSRSAVTRRRSPRDSVTRPTTCSASTRSRLSERVPGGGRGERGLVDESPRAAPVSEEPWVFRPGAVSCLRIPAPDTARLADFYRGTFGWIIRGDPGEPSFRDGSGHVIGHFMPDLPVGGDAGVRPYIYVEHIDESLGRITAHGGEVTVPPYPEGDLWVALFRDPAGNIVGVWQQGVRP